MMMIKFVFTFFLFTFSPILALENGLARTPPMGWLSWERYRCNIDCVNDPDNCISEKLFKDMADKMASEGYKTAGYQYVIIDDCWSEKSRDSAGRLQADKKRFPSGIKKLADYIHAKGLKFGIYGDFGTLTCGGYPGSLYYLEIDARTFAEWGVDYFKMDGCYAEIVTMDDGYPAMGFWLNQTGRPIVYSCSWPAYQEGTIVPNYEKIAKYCNLWRNYNDIEDSWESVTGIIKFYGDDKTNFSKYGGPGHFNDPDMLIIGNFGLSIEQQRSQMALWCIMASPLIMSNDLRNMDPVSKALLQNQFAIAINQDSLGVQGRRIKQIGRIDIWTKPLSTPNCAAFVFLNLGTSTPTKVSIKLSELGLQGKNGYKIYEVFSNKPFDKVYFLNSTFESSVNPSGVFFGKAIAL